MRETAYSPLPPQSTLLEILGNHDKRQTNCEAPDSRETAKIYGSHVYELKKVKTPMKTAYRHHLPRHHQRTFTRGILTGVCYVNDSPQPRAPRNPDFRDFKISQYEEIAESRVNKIMAVDVKNKVHIEN